MFTSILTFEQGADERNKKFRSVKSLKHLFCLCTDPRGNRLHSNCLNEHDMIYSLRFYIGMNFVAFLSQFEYNYIPKSMLIPL